MKNFDEINNLAMFMIKLVGENKARANQVNTGLDWDWVASEVWRTFPGIVNEFLINDAIDFLLEAAEIEE
jgi:hypothetical protein